MLRFAILLSIYEVYMLNGGLLKLAAQEEHAMNMLMLALIADKRSNTSCHRSRKL